jgi:hypothetical protein
MVAIAEFLVGGAGAEGMDVLKGWRWDVHVMNTNGLRSLDRTRLL